MLLRKKKINELYNEIEKYARIEHWARTKIQIVWNMSSKQVKTVTDCIADWSQRGSTRLDAVTSVAPCLVKLALQFNSARIHSLRRLHAQCSRTVLAMTWSLCSTRMSSQSDGWCWPTRWLNDSTTRTCSSSGRRRAMLGWLCSLLVYAFTVGWTSNRWINTTNTALNKIIINSSFIIFVYVYIKI